MTHYQGTPGDQCPGCGAASCACTPTDIRAALETDRAAMSDRLAASEMRANEWAGLVRDLLATFSGTSETEKARLRAQAKAMGVE